MLTDSNIKIIRNKLYYNTDRYKYKIENDIYSTGRNRYTVLRVTITYKNSLTTRYYSNLKRNIPNKHKNIIKDLFEYYESNVLMLMILQGIKFYKYINWLEDDEVLYEQ